MQTSMQSSLGQRRPAAAPARCSRSLAVTRRLLPPVKAADTSTTPPVATSGVEEVVSKLKQAAKQPGSVPPAVVLSSIVALEKAKVQPSPAWLEAITAPGARWRLVYTAPSKDVVPATKGQKGGAGVYVPLTAAQKFDTTPEPIFENGVFLGPVAHLTFKGPFIFEGRKLTFEVDVMSLGLGPLKGDITLKKSSGPLAARPKEEVRKIPSWFLYAYVDRDIIVGRGPSGGVALWSNTDAAWQASSGVLQVYK